MEIREPKKNEISVENKVIRLIVINMYIYIYIYLSVKEFIRLLHCRSPLIFSFINSIELSVDVEVKQFGALSLTHDTQKPNQIYVRDPIKKKKNLYNRNV